MNPGYLYMLIAGVTTSVMLVIYLAYCWGKQSDIPAKVAVLLWAGVSLLLITVPGFSWSNYHDRYRQDERLAHFQKET